MIGFIKGWLNFAILPLCFGSSDSTSSSSNTTTTNNIDKRIAQQSGVSISGDPGTINVESVDAGIATKALDTIAASDATHGANFTNLLGLADKLFTGAGQVVQKTQDTTIAQIGAINTAANDMKGAIDQKTLLIVGLGIAAMSLLRRKT